MEKEKQSNVTKLTEESKIELFVVEELEDRLETAWNEGCGSVNDQCVNDSCGGNTTCDTKLD
jgi:hypothetical protein